MSAKKPLVYFILGASGSGRREVIADLIEGTLAASDHPVVLLADDENPDDFDVKLPVGGRWSWQEETIAAELPPEATHVFFVTSGRRDPVEQTEVFKGWLEARGAELGRILCVVNCQLAEKNPPLLAWYEACVHFSDVVLLNRREGVENKWVSGFLAHFEKLHYPCLFEMVKGGRVRNPALVLEPEARRMTHVFDEEQDWIFTDGEGNEIDEQEETEGEEEVEAAVEEDPYFVRDAAGRRAKRLPDIAKFL
ncbi:MAG: hypothetical protein RIQ93_1042 [Verrucomicrobiota bacterium]|jgi:hypothetical protein